jgi:hypothetical protein
VKKVNLTLHELRRETGRWVLAPSRLLAGLAAGMWGAGSALMVYFSTIPFRAKNPNSAVLWLGVIFLLVAGYSAGLAIWAWRARRTPLFIDVGGRVSYGHRELCAAGTVRAVRIAEARGGEAGDCEVGFELNGAKMVFLPAQFFAVFKSREHARAFAAELAEVLAVPVTESH